MSWLEWIEAWPGAVLLKNSGTLYLFVNAAHILGICLLVGAILPLDLRLVGLFSSVPVQVLGPFLIRAAMTGLALAALTGLWLFSVNAKEYAGNAAFFWKLGLLGSALAVVALQHTGPQLQAALNGDVIAPRVRMLAVTSAFLWLAVLVAGRWIGFV